MKRNSTLFIIVLILLFVGIPLLLSAADKPPDPRSRITPVGLNLNFQQRELSASPQIKQTLQTLRAQITAQNLTFEVGYTAAADFPLSQLATLKVPANLAAQITAQNALAMQSMQGMATTPAVCSAGAAKFDWRQGGGATPVKDQGGCGSCWDFATVGAFEGSWRIVNNETINASEQDVLDCSGAGSCGGGWWAFNYLINKKVADEANYGYTAVKGACKSVARPYGAVTWGYVGTDHNIPTVAALKQALCTHGPLAVAVNATSAFQHYTGGVFNEHNTTKINHGVTLIGWDDSKQAWLVKNSWGTGWGSTCDYGTERGYIWIAYGSNNIGYAAAWTKAAEKPKPITEDCVSFNPATATVKKINNSWKIVDGDHWMFDFKANQAAAVKSLSVIKNYKMNRSCFVGRPDPSFSYLLVGTNAPVGNMSGQDCIKFDPAKIEVKQIGGRWKIVQGSMWMYDFGDKQAEAVFSLQMIKKYGFTNQCFVARPNPPFQYLHK